MFWGLFVFFQETTLYSKKKPAPHDKPGLFFLLSEDTDWKQLK